jgi:hypothetical protein
MGRKYELEAEQILDTFCPINLYSGCGILFNKKKFLAEITVCWAGNGIEVRVMALMISRS